MFFGRKKELEFFENKYKRNTGQLVVLYGRRRIGKTELLRQFTKGKSHVFYSCTETTDDKQLEGFSKRIINYYSESEYLKGFDSWDEALRYFAAIEVDEKKLLVIDEFPYMVKTNREIPSIIQNLWDKELKDENIMIVLCGSSMSFIENEILAEKNPLYGRTSGIYKMKPMTFEESCEFFRSFSFEEKIISYGITGGIPHYLKQFDDQLSIEKNIKESLLTKGNTLYNEVEFLMRQELRETNIYNTLISVIAFGNTKMNEIYQKTGIEKAKIGVYLKNLIDLGIIEREFPVTERLKATVNFQRGLYKITNNYFKFWYKFLFPNMSELEEGEVNEVFQTAIQPFLAQHIGFVFEEICIQYLKKLNNENSLPIRFTKIGRWWDKQNEIDIMAFDQEGSCILGECKWQNEKMNLKVLKDLDEKAKKLNLKNSALYLFSKSGFANSLIEVQENRNDVTLISLSEIETKYVDSF